MKRMDGVLAWAYTKRAFASLQAAIADALEQSEVARSVGEMASAAADRVAETLGLDAIGR